MSAVNKLYTLIEFKNRYKEVRKEYLKLYKLYLKYIKYKTENDEIYNYINIMGLDYIVTRNLKDKSYASTYTIICISPKYYKTKMKECEIELCLLKRNMKVIRKELNNKYYINIE